MLLIITLRSTVTYRLPYPLISFTVLGLSVVFDGVDDSFFLKAFLHLAFEEEALWLSLCLLSTSQYIGCLYAQNLSFEVFYVLTLLFLNPKISRGSLPVLCFKYPIHSDEFQIQVTLEHYGFNLCRSTLLFLEICDNLKKTHVAQK
jgi:hypothetical protein